MDGDWAVRKTTWMDSQIATVNETIEKIRAAELGNEEETTGARSFMASREGLAKPLCVQNLQDVSWRGVPIQEQTSRRTPTQF